MNLRELVETMRLGLIHEEVDASTGGKVFILDHRLNPIERPTCESWNRGVREAMRLAINSLAPTPEFHAELLARIEAPHELTPQAREKIRRKLEGKRFTKKKKGARHDLAEERVAVPQEEVVLHDDRS